MRNNRLVLVGFTIAVFYWMADSITSAYVLRTGNLFVQLFKPAPAVLILRLLVVCALTGFMYLLQRVLDKLEKTRDMLSPFSRAVETMQLGVTFTDLSGKILYTNPAEAAMHGYTVDELKGMDARMLAPKKLWCPMTLGQIKELKTLRRESLNLKKDGTVFPVRLLSDVVTDKSGSPVGIVTSCEDISERKKTEEELRDAHNELERRVEERTTELSETVKKLTEQMEERNKLELQLRHAQKMEAIGQLAGGVAHDFNNILTAIISYVYMIQTKLPESDPLNAYMAQILSASQRAAHLTRSLLAFSRKQVLTMERTNINEIVERIQKLLLRIIPENIKMEVMTTEADIPVIADITQVEQVLMNLVTNARDAMPEGGALTISTGIEKMGERFVKSHGYGKAGSYAVVSVKDIGIGMDDETKKKIFDPFFTTKEVGKGTGLGLSIVYGIVNQHGGFMNVESAPGRGAEFKIYIPLTSLLAAPKSEEKPADIPQGTETILLAEDQADVRNISKTVLEDAGYTVIEAVNGEDALNKFIENKDRIVFVLLDLVMPVKSGKEAYLRMKELKPEIKELFVSGYASDFIQKKEVIDEGLNFLPKPVAPTELLRKVRQILDSKK